MAYATINDTTLYHERLGAGSPILVLHDGLLDSGAWAAVARALAERNEVILYDRRGYGKSAAAKAPYSNLEDLVAFLDAIQVDAVSLIACSMGGALALDYALRHPRRVSRLALVGAVINGFPYSDHMNGRNRENYRPLVERGDVEACIRAWSEDHYLTSAKNPAAKGELYRHLCANYGNLVNDPRLIRDDAVGASARLGEIMAPTLVVVGEDDIPDVHAQAGALENGIVGARRILIRECGHLPYFERPDSFLGAIQGFIAGTEA